MKSSIDHLPPAKQHQLARAQEILFDEFADALAGGTAEFKKRGRILKIILFGSYSRGSWVDEPHIGKGYRSDLDLLIVVNNRKLADFTTYWNRAADRLMREVDTPVSLIVHSLREVNTALEHGQYFFRDIRRDGIALYELDDEPLAEPKPLTPKDAYETAKEHFETRFPYVSGFNKVFKFCLNERDYKLAAFNLHQTLESAYVTLLLVQTNYSPQSHNLKFLRRLAEGQEQRLAVIWPRTEQPFVKWFNVLNEAYVKARYARHYEISGEALTWLCERTAELINEIEAICRARLETLKDEADRYAQRVNAANR